MEKQIRRNKPPRILGRRRAIVFSTLDSPEFRSSCSWIRQNSGLRSWIRQNSGLRSWIRQNSGLVAGFARIQGCVQEFWRIRLRTRIQVFVYVRPNSGESGYEDLEFRLFVRSTEFWRIRLRRHRIQGFVRSTEFWRIRLRRESFYMLSYRYLWPIVRLVPAEMAHHLGMVLLRLPVRFASTVDDPFTWRGLTFRNRVGVAAGFDKNASCLHGVQRLGAGFLEFGTVLVEPWSGNPARPRMKRLTSEHAVWNRLGFPSAGLSKVEANLATISAFAAQRDASLGQCRSPSRTRESREFATRISRYCAPRIINALATSTSPQRCPCGQSQFAKIHQVCAVLLESADLGSEVMIPLRQRLTELDGTTRTTPMLLKLPPEDSTRAPWTRESLKQIIEPLLERNAIDGIVAVNTSTQLATQLIPMSDDKGTGGVSGEPLRRQALETVTLVRELIGEELLLIGLGGITAPEHVGEFLQAGANVVEVYSGMIYRGPGFVSACAQTAKAK